jgi:hypothetical protein
MSCTRWVVVLFARSVPCRLAFGVLRPQFRYRASSVTVQSRYKVRLHHSDRPRTRLILLRGESLGTKGNSLATYSESGGRLREIER